jgi:hypothetical protein
MALYNTPGGTPLNASPFQGTAPGFNAPIQQANPGVGMFPPNANNASGDTVLAAQSRAAVPLNVQVNNFGVVGMALGPNTTPAGRSLAEAESRGWAVGTGAQYQTNGGSANQAPCGSNSLGAGGFNQTNYPGSGEVTTMPTAMPAGNLSINGGANPSFQG